MSSTEPMLKAREVAERLGVHVNTVKRMGDRSEIPFYRIGPRGDRRFRPVDIEAYLEQRSSKNGSGRRPGQTVPHRGAENG